MAKPKWVTRQVVEGRERWTRIIREWRRSGLGVRAFCRKHGVPEYDPDNNEAERAFRPVAVGRKNWLFCGSDTGGRTAAVLMSICASCRARWRARLHVRRTNAPGKHHGVNTFAYIRDMLVRVSTEPASRIRALLRRGYGGQRTP